MVSRPGDFPALEAGSGVSDGLLGGMSIPVGMTRRAISYDDNLERPMSPPPTDINISNLWKRPVIPERKFARLAEEDESDGGAKQSVTFGSSKPQIPVVKAKASSVMNSLIIKQTQESMHKFEKQAGLTDTGYTPHKGLAAEETRFHRLAESMHKLAMQNVDNKEEKQPSSGQSTPAGTPQSSPKQIRRGWFSSQGSTASLTGSEMSTSSSIDLSTGEGAVERWSVFGPRSQVSKSTTDPGADPAPSGGFALQSYKGAQKPTPMEMMKAQATRLSEDSAGFKAPPKMEIPTVEGKRQTTRPHKLKHRDMNVLTPSGF
ncbi:putative monooxygenase p33MONOX [Triplophysa tibetana]|uniref:Putative monooxygenase p33MONOX n=1 Tax=Triplophysa tibetana TaxID=1572043 RepID=A0A5A9PEL7_9TELE|nr:putative monooxygenase p33MONOX [Triplophysa tibetana]